MCVPTPDILGLSMTGFMHPTLTSNLFWNQNDLELCMLARGASMLFYAVLQMDLRPSCMLGKHSTTDLHPISFANFHDILGMMWGPASSALLSQALRASTGDNSAPAAALLVALPVPLCDQVMTKVSYPFAL